jgi:hypothetical protein
VAVEVPGECPVRSRLRSHRLPSPTYYNASTRTHCLAHMQIDLCILMDISGYVVQRAKMCAYKIGARRFAISRVAQAARFSRE